MFTEGLDECALNWVKLKQQQGSGGDGSRVLPPLTEKSSYGPDLFPKSPLAYAGANTCISTSHLLPPLKFHSGLLAPHSLVPPSFGGCDSDSYDKDDVEDEESVGSAPYQGKGVCNEEEVPAEKSAFIDCYGADDMFVNEPSVGLKQGTSSLNRGILLESLRIDVPGDMRRFTTAGEMGNRSSGASSLTPGPATANGRILRDHVLLRNSNLSNVGLIGRDESELGTPSAPPVMDAENGIEAESDQERVLENSAETQKTVGYRCLSDEMEVSEDGENVNRISQALEDVHTAEGGGKRVADQSDAQFPNRQANSLDHSPRYSVSGQNAWQTLIAYDACIRLCLYAWARGCQEAPEFLRDECLVLRKAFGLQKFLLHPRNVKIREASGTKNEDAFPRKGKTSVGKIRVEVRRIRVVPKRQLKSTHSQQSAFYLQAGAEYIRQISSLVKTGVTSFKLSPFTITSEECLSCLFQLRSSLEDPQAESTSICLRPGSGESHIFFPESQGDALLLEVQDKKKSILGRATIPVSSMTDNPNEKIRWLSIYDDDNVCIGKIQLCLGVTVTSDDAHNVKSGTVVETLAYELVLNAAMRAQNFHSRNLRLHGPWKWLLFEFADYYEVSESYTKLRYLSQIMNVATPTRDCLELIYELLVPTLKAKTEKILTRQEKGILLDCENQIENLLACVFENYKSLDETSATGLVNVFTSIPESVAPALAPAVQVFTLLHDVLTEDAQNRLRNYLQTAAKKRCQKYLLETDEFLSSNSENSLVDQVTMSTAYLKMKNLCNYLSSEIQADIKIDNQHILPSSIDLSNIGAAVYSVQLAKRIDAFLGAWPPSSPLPYVNDLLKATADFERNLESWNISPVQGGLDSRSIFHSYILVWIQDVQLNLLELCKAEKVPWSGVMTNHFTSPFAEEMYNKIKKALLEYEVVINHWPQYSLILENAVTDVERAIIKALEKQYNDILTPLKDSIPKRLNMQVQKLTRRQSTSVYCVPSQLGIFLNTLKRILDVLHNNVEDILKCWASYLPATGDKRSLFGEQMNSVTVLLRTRYKNYLQGIVGNLMNNMQANRSTRLKRILEETTEEDREPEIRERMQILRSQLIDTVSNLHEVFSSQIFVSLCRGLWDNLGQIILKFLEGRKENRVWYNGSYHALVILDDTFASQMQRLMGNALQEKDVEPPRSVIEARSILCKDSANNVDSSSYFFV